MVTGAGRGLGREIALQLAAAGADLALLARSTDELAETAAGVRAAGRAALALPIDLAETETIAAAAGRAGAELAPVDLLVNNAATLGPVQRSAELDPADWAEAIRVNLVAVATLTFALLPAMLDRGWGRIVNLSSGIVRQPQVMVRGNAYVTSKVALEAHTLNLAAELDGSGVTVNVFRPGKMDTSQQAWLRAQSPEAIGPALHQRYTGFATEGVLIDPATSAAALLNHLGEDANGDVWEI